MRISERWSWLRRFRTFSPLADTISQIIAYSRRVAPAQTRSCFLCFAMHWDRAFSKRSTLFWPNRADWCDSPMAQIRSRFHGGYREDVWSQDWIIQPTALQEESHLHNWKITALGGRAHLAWLKLRIFGSTRRRILILRSIEKKVR